MTRLIPDYINVARIWWTSMGPDLSLPFTPGFLRGGNDGIVRSANGAEIVNCGGNEAKADVIAASLNYIAVVKEKTPFTISVDKSHYRMGIEDERNRVLKLLEATKVDGVQRYSVIEDLIKSVKNA